MVHISAVPSRDRTESGVIGLFTTDLSYLRQPHSRVEVAFYLGFESCLISASRCACLLAAPRLFSTWSEVLSEYAAALGKDSWGLASFKTDCRRIMQWLYIPPSRSFSEVVFVKIPSSTFVTGTIHSEGLLGWPPSTELYRKIAVMRNQQRRISGFCKL